MIQVHTLILWAPPAKGEDFKITAERGYALLLALKKFGPELSPIYQTVNKKSDAKPLEGTYEEFEEILRKGVRKEGKTVFIDLGYSISFFSSLDNKKSSGIRLTVGITNPKFKNTFIIELSQSLPVYERLTSEKMKDLFKNCVEIFKPFWGCIGNDVNSNRFNGYWKESMPTTVHWLNYFGADLVERLGNQKIEKAPVEKVDRLGDGYLIQLQKLPIDDTSEETLSRQLQANKYFGLKQN